MISIILPVKNERERIRPLLQQLEKCKNVCELIVVDGGSSDGTPDLARPYARVIETEPGRGHQLHCGALAARGRILWFLHADATVDPSATVAIAQAFEKDEPPVAGSFRLYFDDVSDWRMQMLAWTSNLRARYFGLVFGDQGLFLSRAVYMQSGGFRPLALMEDWEFARRLWKTGPFVQLPVYLGTSGRRYRAGGFWRTLFQMHAIKWRYVRGVSPDRLAKEYKEIRS